MRISNQDKDKKKKKKEQSWIEKELYFLIKSGLKTTIDQALDEILKDFNK